MVESIFREKGHEIDSNIVQPGALDLELKAAVAKAPDGIIIAGGDGTVSAAVRHLGGTAIALGIVPMGTFNLAARDLGVPLGIEEACRFLAQARKIKVDVLDVAGHACLCTTILGFYPEFAKTFERRDHGGHWWKKAILCITSLPRTFKEARSLRLKWKSDSGEGQARTKFSAFVPGRYKAAAGIVPLRTDFLSGTMTAYVGRQRHAGAAMRGMFDYIFGRQEMNEELTIFKTGRLELRATGRRHAMVMIDGEILRMKFPLIMTILPAHLNVLATEEILEEQA
jgi:diacylglycerol kinase family enzyme